MIAALNKLIKVIVPLRYGGNWSRGGEGWERQHKLIGPLRYYRRTEDQVWSPHYTERRIERGLTLDSLGGPDKPRLAWVTVVRIFKKPVARA